ncbi:hypothetical protein [Sulfurimonas sp. C5]|uniref:hypothetical protein n=1 Tax=Sulfurimonas sp. C5 TaxID=3036947 RepID=UPI0024585C7B|nr:hypothetical protein [Sulfurimonas sp. C5]MDH4945210.1 hypothetical protein [Sulfurimonas sp. C5]
MKQKVNITIVTFITLVSLSGCTTSTGTSANNGNMKNDISATTINKKAGFMQRSLDNWLKEDWSPTVEKDPEIQKKYMKQEVVVEEEQNTTTSQETTQEVKYTENKERSFTLQEYVDKAVAYQKAKPNDENSSHVKQMESLPVIGK